MSFLGEVLLRGGVVSIVGAVAVALMGRVSAATRAAVGAVVLGAMLALPLGLLVVPKRAVPVERVPFRRIVFPSAPFSAKLPARESPAAFPDRPSRRPQAFPVGGILVAIWASGACGLLLRTATGWLVASGWVRRGRLSAADSESVGIDVLLSDEIAVPCALWVGRAIVLLPADSVDWSAGRRRAVLLHEAAHVRRGDWTVLILARFAVALHWPNPLVWALARVVRRASEDAADDAVLRSGLAPADYAEHLLALAPRRLDPTLALPMASRPDVHRRVRHVLNPNRTRGSIRFATLALASLFVGGVFVPAASLVRFNIAPLVSGRTSRLRLTPTFGRDGRRPARRPTTSWAALPTERRPRSSKSR